MDAESDEDKTVTCGERADSSPREIPSASHDSTFRHFTPSKVCDRTVVVHVKHKDLANYALSFD